MRRLLLAATLLALAASPLPAAGADETRAVTSGASGTGEVRTAALDPEESDDFNVPAAPGSDYIDLSMPRADLRGALRTIAKLADVSLVVQDNVQGTISVQLKDVYYERALEMITLSGGFALSRIADRTYMVGDAKTISTAAGAAGYRIFRLRFQKAGEIVEKIGALFGKRLDFRIATAYGEDRVMVSAAPKVLEEINTLIADLDVAPPNIRSTFTLLRVVAGPGGKDSETALASFVVLSASGWKSKVVNTHKYPLGKGADGIERRGEIMTELVLLAVAAGEGRIPVVLEGKFVVDESCVRRMPGVSQDPANTDSRNDPGATKFQEDVLTRLIVAEGVPRDVAVYKEASGETLVLRMQAEVETPK